MSALGFLGGLGTTVGAMQKGYEQSEDREAIRKEREFLAGQRQRKLDEQKRADDLRNADAGVATTEEIDDPNWKPAPASERGVAQVTVNEDGSESVIPAEPQQSAPKISRKRDWDSIYRDYSANRLKIGDTVGAIEFEQKADKLAFDRASRKFNELASGAETMSLPQLARSYAQIFHNDPFGGKVDDVVDNPDGSVTIKTSNKETGVNKVVTYKSKDELTSSLQGYYQPETRAKIQQAQLEAALKRQEKEFEYKNDPSKRFQKFSANQTVFDAATGKIVQQGVKAGGTPVYDEDGNITGYTGGGNAGSGAKQPKGKDPLAVATSSVMDAIKESAESKTLNADQLIGVQATARELVANAARSGQELDPYVAGKVALTAVLKPESVKPAYNPATGQFNSTVSFNGNTFSVGRIDPTALPESQLKGVAQTFVSKLPAEAKAEYIRAASGDKAATDKINSDIAAAHGKEWASQFRAANGRAPTQQDVQASIARTQSVVDQNIRLVAASGAIEQDKKQRDTAAKNQAAAAAKAAIGTPEQIMALPPGKAAEIYRQYGGQTDAFQREALQMKMQQDRRSSMTVGGLR